MKANFCQHQLKPGSFSNFANVLNKLYCIAIILVLASCRDIEISPELSSSNELNKEVYLQDDYLVFTDAKIFQRALLYSEENIINDKYQEWENTDGFHSLNRLYNEALEEQDKFSGEDWSPFIVKNKDYFVFEEDGSFDVKMFHSPLRSLVNINGIVKVENVLYQFTRDKVKLFVGNDVNTLLNAESEDIKNKLYIRDITGNLSRKKSYINATSFYSYNLYGEGGKTDPNLANRVLFGSVRQNTIFFPTYDPQTDLFLGDLPITSLYCGINYYKGKNDKVISTSTKWIVGVGIKIALKILGVPSALSFIWDIVAENLRKNYIQTTPARILLLSYNVRIANGYETLTRQSSQQRSNSGGFGFYITIPNNNTSQPEAFYMLSGSFNFFSEENIGGTNRSLSFQLSYPGGDIKYAGNP